MTMTQRRSRRGRTGIVGALVLALGMGVGVVGVDASTPPATDTAATDTAATAAAPSGTLEVALLDDVDEFDPQAFSAVNFPVIKNLYDSLIEYAPDGSATPALATEWTIAEDGTSVTLKLRDGVVFSTGNPLNSAAVAATLEKAADPDKGKNLFSTMAIVKDWATPDDSTVTVNFKAPTAERQITDLLEFLSIIDPAGIADVANTPAGTGPFTLESRSLGTEMTLVANPNYWREGPFLEKIHFTIFDDADAASAALESGQVELIFNVSGREAKRLSEAGGYTTVEGPGPLVQVLRINPNHGPFKNKTFRQAMAYMLNRADYLEVGYAGVGEVTALPWAPSSPAADPSYNDTYAFNPDKAKELMTQSGLSEAEMSGWKVLVNSADQAAVDISQIFQSDLAAVGVTAELELLEGSALTDRLLAGEFDVIFAGVGNVQKFPSRLSTNSIFRTAKNPVVGDPMFPEYVAAIEQVNTTLGPDDAIKAAYDNLNKVIMDLAFGLATNTFQFGLIVHKDGLQGVELDIDNIFIGRTIKK